MSTRCRNGDHPLDARTLAAGGEVCFDCATGTEPTADRTRSWSRRLSNTGRDYRIVDMPPALKAKLVELAAQQRCPLREIVIAALTVYAYKRELKS